LEQYIARGYFVVRFCFAIWFRNETSVETSEVTWPSGKQQTLKNVKKANQRLTVKERKPPSSESISNSKRNV
jgi:hypothetical protein